MISNSLKLTFSYTGGVQTWVVPYTGNYQLEAWGAQGGDMIISPWTGKGGKGGYACGKAKLTRGQIIYLYIGGQGQGYNGSTNHPGGWNGGGTCYAGASGGGGATDIRTKIDDLYSRILVAGGGGGSNDHTNGGAGGGLTGSNGQAVDGYPGCGGTQVSGGSGWINGSFGIGGGAANSYGDGGSGGAGWYGGGKANGYNSSGGGGSSYIGGVMDGSTTAGVNSGNGKIVITCYEEYFFLESNGEYYIPNEENFDINSNSFHSFSLSAIKDYIKTGSLCVLSELNVPFTINGMIYTLSNILDLSKCRICILNEDNLYKLNINYTPSNIALSKTNIKIKDKYIPVDDELDHTFLDITSTNKSKIDYFLDYEQAKSYKSCSILNTDIINNNFYGNFKLNSADSLLKSVTLYGKNNNKYAKLKNTDIDIYDNLQDKKFIKFNNDYNEVTINKLSKQSLDYTIDSLDKF